MIGENRKEQDMMKRIAAVAAVSLVALQLVAGGALAAGKHLGGNPHNNTPAASGCSLIAGTAVISGGGGQAEVWTDGKWLHCNNGSWTGTDVDTADPLDGGPLLSDVDKLLTQGDGGVVLYLAAIDGNGDPVTVLGNTKSANYGGLHVTVDTSDVLYFDATGLDSAYFGSTMKVTNTSFSGMGLAGTIYYADSLEFDGGDGIDSFDASSVAADTVQNGGPGSDTLKGGSGDDQIDGDAGSDKIYGGAGDDALDCSDAGNDQCWGGAGDDAILVGGSVADVTNDTVAPGDGYDGIQGSGSDTVVLTYVDSSAAVDTTYGSTGEIDTTNDFDFFTGVVVTAFAGSPKGDLILGDSWVDVIDGGAGNDVIKGDNDDNVLKGGTGNDTIRGRGGDDVVRGNGGDDVLYGGAGDDSLLGGPGSDQTWGDGGKDLCGGEVKDSCELILA